MSGSGLASDTLPVVLFLSLPWRGTPLLSLVYRILMILIITIIINIIDCYCYCQCCYCRYYYYYNEDLFFIIAVFINVIINAVIVLVIYF